MAISSKTALWLSRLVVLAAIFAHVDGDVAEDKKQCQGRLVSKLSSCFSFVNGNSKFPVPSCCTKLSENYDITTRTCLCIAVRDSNDPNLGFNINATLALSLPYVCRINNANVSECPDLLHMDHNSADARVFLQFNGTSAVQDITTSTNGSMKISRVELGTIRFFFMWIVFSVFFHQI